MSFSFQRRTVSGVTIIDVKGRITLGLGNVELREQVNNALEAGARNILLNLAELSYLDSSGVGTLVSCFTTANRQGAKLKLVNLTKKMNELLAITKLITVFDCFEDENEAVASFLEIGVAI